MPKRILFSFFLIIVLSSCHHHRDAWNPYLHSRHKPSDEVKEGFAKQDRMMHRRKNWFFFKKKKRRR